VVRTALNVNISRWRRRRREIPVPDLGALADQPAAAAGAQDPVDPPIMAAIQRLPAGQRQVIALRHPRRPQASPPPFRPEWPPPSFRRSTSINKGF
jgi:hypothetical protein